MVLNGVGGIWRGQASVVGFPARVWLAISSGYVRVVLGFLRVVGPGVEFSRRWRGDPAGGWSLGCSAAQQWMARVAPVARHRGGLVADWEAPGRL